MSDIVKSAKQPFGRRRDVLRMLRAATSPMSIVATADALDVHPNTVRFHLDTLVSTGRVDQVAPDRKGPGRPALMFGASRRMDTGGPRHYRLLAEILATDLASNRDAEAKALAAGRAWDVQLKPPAPTTAGTPDAEESIEHLVGLLDELGFAPWASRRRSGGAAALPVPGTGGRPESHRLSDSPGAHAGRTGKLGGAGHGRSAGPVRRAGSVSGSVRPAGRGDVSLASAVAVAVVFVWLGMVLAISFLEAPLKFRAPNVTLEIGLGIGRLVFRALNIVEVVLAIVILLTSLARPPYAGAAAALAVVFAALALQIGAVRPRLNRRTDQVLAGLDAPRSRGHYVYIGLEAIKALALAAGGMLLLNN
jgi:predicted ArsR family transcriptional regulator